MRTINYIDLGTRDYGETLDIQHFLLGKIQNGELEDTLILVEHPHVLTMGRRAKDENIHACDSMLEEKGIKVYRINRGGDVTYHGFGQLVGYPVFNLENHGKDIKRFVRAIEDSIIDNLRINHNIDAGIDEGVYTGVWTGGKKICAIGIGVKKWVSYHGFAYNVNTELEYFRYINPCGLGDGTVTSLSEIKGRVMPFETEKQNVLEALCARFGVQWRKTECVASEGGYVII